MQQTAATPVIGLEEIGPNAAQPSRFLRVALVNMPFAAAHRPSIACGLLKAGLITAGHTADVYYLNLELAAELGADVYRMMAVRTDQFLGEWLFSVAAFGYRPVEDAYRRMFGDLDVAEQRIGLGFEDLCRLRNETIPALVERWLGAVDWGSYDAVGFTSTFEQNVAALALARRIKEQHPGAVTIFGGANFDGEMGPEYVRAFPWIDYGVVGEGDDVLVALAGRLARGESAAGLPGVVTRDCTGTLLNGGEAPSVRELDRLPDPDYEEFFATLQRLGRERVLGLAPPILLFESARGCWWGQKHHCTFCGLNANGMAYRSKSPQRIHDELRRMAARYGIVEFEAVDNIIDMRYIEELCRPIAEARVDYTFFWEVKANLTRQQLLTMRRAGITYIQPGIESLSTHILTLMRKGTTMLRNLRLLKWAHYYGIRVSWNVITGFPGETPADYQQQERLLPLIVHLPPPSVCGPLWLERFSPYYMESGFPVKNVRPREAYRFVYPEEQIDLDKIAYFFDYEMDETVPAEELGRLAKLIEDWQTRWRSAAQPVLVYQRAPDWLRVIDRRTPQPQAYNFQGPEAGAYEFCADSDHSAERVATHLDETYGTGSDAERARTMLRRFCDMGLMVEEGGHYLSLALPINGNW